MQGFIPKHGHNTGRVNKQQTGMAGARHRVSLGQAWVDDRRTISNRGKAKRDNPGKQAIIQRGANRVQRARLRVNPGKHGQESKHRKTQKARQNYDNNVGSVE